MEELKPCPFCGGKAKVIKPVATWMLKKYHGRYVCVGCESCHVSTPLFNANNHTGSPLINKAHEKSAIKNAIEAWNTRKPDCSNANHDATGCLGYGKGSEDDEPIEPCIRCKEYTGNKSGDCDPL